MYKRISFNISDKCNQFIHIEPIIFTNWLYLSLILNFYYRWILFAFYYNFTDYISSAKWENLRTPIFDEIVILISLDSSRRDRWNETRLPILSKTGVGRFSNLVYDIKY